MVDSLAASIDQELTLLVLPSQRHAGYIMLVRELMQEARAITTKSGSRYPLKAKPADVLPDEISLIPKALFGSRLQAQIYNHPEASNGKSMMTSPIRVVTLEDGSEIEIKRFGAVASLGPVLIGSPR